MNTYLIEHEGRTFTPDGEIPAMAAPGDRLGCGHTRPRARGCIFPGYVIRDNGRTMCRWCANRAAVRDFRRGDAYVGYLAGRNPRHVTSWLGAPLCRITRQHTSDRIWMPGGYGSYRIVTVRATAADGSHWYGRGTDNDQIIRLRRCKSTPRWDR